MELWLILIVIVIVLAAVVSSKIVSGGGFMDFSGFFKMYIWGIAAIFCLVFYIVHLKGCLNQEFGVATMSVGQAEILPVKEVINEME